MCMHAEQSQFYFYYFEMILFNSLTFNRRTVQFGCVNFISSSSIALRICIHARTRSIWIDRLHSANRYNQSQIYQFFECRKFNYSNDDDVHLQAHLWSPGRKSHPLAIKYISVYCLLFVVMRMWYVKRLIIYYYLK